MYPHLHRRQGSCCSFVPRPCRSRSRTHFHRCLTLDSLRQSYPCSVLNLSIQPAPSCSHLPTAAVDVEPESMNVVEKDAEDRSRKPKSMQ